MGDMVFFFFKQKTAYEMRISDWSSDVCSSDLCSMVPVGNAGCKGNKVNYYPRGTKTVRTVVTQTDTTTTRTPLTGQTAACYNDAGSCSTAGFTIGRAHV